MRSSSPSSGHPSLRQRECRFHTTSGLLHKPMWPISRLERVDRSRKTSSMLANGLSRSFRRRASLVVTFIGVWALVLIQPVFAQTDDGSTLEISSAGEGSSTIEYRVESVDSARPSFDEPWDATPPSVQGPAQAPPPEEFMAPEPTPMSVQKPPKLDE